jgi:prepilin-type N-terminal cleavage/methylation domain-containing protein
MNSQQSPVQNGFTLVELLVVIFLISILLTLTVMFVIPSFSDNKNVVRGLDQVTIMLLTAKQRALRDQAPRGVRFLATNGIATQLQFVQLPDAVVGGQVTVAAAPANNTATFTGLDLLGAGDPANPYNGWNVQPGDYLRFAGSGNYPISAVTWTPAMTVTLRDPVLAPVPPFTTTQYQIIRQTRPVSGEAPVDLPNNVAIDLNVVAANSPANQVPQGMFPSQAGFYEIVFDVGGGVMNQGGSTPIGMIIRDITADPGPGGALEPNTARALAVYPRTGMIAGHPIPASGNPLQFALDGKSSGI